MGSSRSRLLVQILPRSARLYLSAAKQKYVRLPSRCPGYWEGPSMVQIEMKGMFRASREKLMKVLEMHFDETLIGPGNTRLRVMIW